MKDNVTQEDFLTACHKSFGSSRRRGICYSRQLPPWVFQLVPLKHDTISEKIIFFTVAFVCDLLAYRHVNCAASLNISAKSWPKLLLSPPLHWPNDLREERGISNNLPVFKKTPSHSFTTIKYQEQINNVIYIFFFFFRKNMHVLPTVSSHFKHQLLVISVKGNG